MAAGVEVAGVEEEARVEVTGVSAATPDIAAVEQSKRYIRQLKKIKSFPKRHLCGAATSLHHRRMWRAATKTVDSVATRASTPGCCCHARAHNFFKPFARV